MSICFGQVFIQDEQLPRDVSLASEIFRTNVKLIQFGKATDRE
jgi:hypothetical protein